jgi:hypothetical protein
VLSDPARRREWEEAMEGESARSKDCFVPQSGDVTLRRCDAGCSE